MSSEKNAVRCAGCGNWIPGIANYVGEGEEARHLGCLPPAPPDPGTLGRELKKKLSAGQPKRKKQRVEEPERAAA